MRKGEIVKSSALSKCCDSLPRRISQLRKQNTEEANQKLPGGKVQGRRDERRQWQTSVEQ